MRLLQPTPDLKAAFVEMAADFLAAGEVRKARGDFDTYLEACLKEAAGDVDGKVPQTTYWLVTDDNRVVGTCRLRHTLTDELWEHGGHVGYDVRPGERSKGYGTEMLRLVIEKAWEQGHPWLLLTIEDTNVASRRVAEKNGAVFLDRAHGTSILRYVIDRDTDIVAVGGALTPERVLDAYRRGVFPWPIEGENYWFSPDPRFVLYPDELRVSKSLRQRIRSNRFDVAFDEDFEGVIDGCTRPEGWITPEYRAAYVELFKRGHVHCVEARRDGKLVGGLYGIALGGMFCGESMFANEPDASKVAFATLVRQLEEWGFGLVDCQQETEHLARFGARAIPREQFLEELHFLLKTPSRPGPWGLPSQRP